MWLRLLVNMYHVLNLGAGVNSVALLLYLVENKKLREENQQLRDDNTKLSQQLVSILKEKGALYT